MNQAIVFDMDGVLFDTERVGGMFWNKVAKEMGFPHGEEALRHCIGLNRTDEEAFFAEHYPDFDLKTFLEIRSEQMREWLDEHGMPLKTGCRELLAWLKEHDWKVALASSTRRDAVMHHLENAGLTSYFDAIITGDMVVHSKPNPEIYLMACAAIQSVPEETYAVEDSPNGLKSAFAAKMQAIMVPDLIEPTEQLRKMTVLVAEDLLTVRDYLKKQ